MFRRSWWLIPALFMLVGCAKTKPVNKTAPAAKKETAVKTLTVTSSAFETGRPIPKKHAYKGEGENVSPPIAWSGAPSGTRSFALICDDPDAPSPKKPREKPWVHWVLYNIPADRNGLDEGSAGGGTEGTNDFKETGWGGPMPPPGSGTHRYFFTVYALDTKLRIPDGATRDQVLAAMKRHIIGAGKAHGTYVRE